MLLGVRGKRLRRLLITGKATTLASMTRNPNHDDIPFHLWVEEAEVWLASFYQKGDDMTLPRIWLFATLAAWWSVTTKGAMAVAVDHAGFSHGDLADALGVSRQAVQQMLLRARGQVKQTAPPHQRERLPGI